MTTVRLADVHVKRFGALNDVRLEGVADGLNVVYGANGSGKTMLLRFLRSLWTGCDSTDPKITRDDGRASLGSVGLRTQAGACRVQLRERPGHCDTLSIQVVGGEASTAKCIRDVFAHFDSRRLNRVNLIDAAALLRAEEAAELIATLPASSIEPVAASTVVRTDGDADERLASLARRRERLKQRVEARRRSADRRQRELHARLRRVQREIAARERRLHLLDGEMQSAVTDLREAEDRLWSKIGPIHIARTGSFSVDPLAAESAEFDRRIAALRELLADLARDRLQLSLEISQPGCRSRIEIQQQRARIDACEAENLYQLDRLLSQRIATSAPRLVHAPSGCTFEENKSARMVEGRRSRVERLQRDAALIRSQLPGLWRDRNEIHTRQRRAAGEKTLDQLRYSLSIVEAKIEDARAARCAKRLAGEWLGRLNVQPPQHAVLTRASQYFSRLTGGKYRRLRHKRSGCGLLADASSGDELPVSALSRGTIEQAAMALRLAALSFNHGQGACLPAVWDEVLADSDEVRLQAAAGLAKKSPDGRGEGNASDQPTESGGSDSPKLTPAQAAAEANALRKVVSRYIDLLGDDDVDVAFSGTSELARIPLLRAGGQPYLDLLKEWKLDLTIPPDPALVAQLEREAGAALLKTLETGKKPFWLRLGSAVSLGDLRHCDAVPALIASLQDKKEALRAASSVALGQITGQKYEFDPAMQKQERRNTQRKYEAWWKANEEEVRKNLQQPK